jgi:SagB-type dehydrogenase family enzyme
MASKDRTRLRAPRTKSATRTRAPVLFARLIERVTLETDASGEIAVVIDGYSASFGTFDRKTAERAQALRTGIAVASLKSGGKGASQGIGALVLRLARRGLIEYRLRASPDGADLLVIEPQVPDYWPRLPRLGEADALVLSRFAYMRRRGSEVVVESPRADALVRICNPQTAAALAALAEPQPVKRMRRRPGFPGTEVLALLFDCRMLFKVKPGETGLRSAEGDDQLVLWDFHDLLFHGRSTQGRHANPLGGLYAHAGVIEAPSAVRARWPGSRVDLPAIAAAAEKGGAFAKLLRERHSTREFDAERPITLAELSQFLDGTARILSKSNGEGVHGDGVPALESTVRPYPSAGGAYELELYLAVNACDGLAAGFYHYDADAHALVPIEVGADDLKTLTAEAEFAMGVPTPPQILVTIAARFGRLSWKYSAIAYSLILKDVGVLLQTFYLAATDMGLGGCAIGIVDIELFARMTGVPFHVEGPVGQFALGRGLIPHGAD